LKRHLSRLFILLFLFLSLSAFSDERPLVRISIENTSTHNQAITVKNFVDKLEGQLGDRYKFLFFPASSLFKDRDVFSALVQGKLEMAFPGSWEFDRFVNDMGIFQLPSFYGRELTYVYNFIESELASSLINEIEQKLSVKVLGNFLDLGYLHLFSTQRNFSSLGAIKSKKVRVPRGEANIARIKALGAIPVVIDWADLPLELKRKNIAFILSDYDSINSTKLYEYGIKSGYEDFQFFGQYIPLMSQRFWDTLTLKEQVIVQQAWQESVRYAKRDSLVAQLNAKENLIAKGIKIKTADDTILKITRDNLLLKEEDIVKALNISDALYNEFATWIQRME
jgi:TRAP-type C4-dicarboxylate transport system substrate-binding protein